MSGVRANVLAPRRQKRAPQFKLKLFDAGDLQFPYEHMGLPFSLAFYIRDAETTQSIGPGSRILQHSITGPSIQAELVVSS